MPIISCPVNGCEWTSDDLDGAFAAVIVQQLQMHDKTTHSTLPTENHKLKIDSPEIGVGANPEEWSAFTRQWSMYKTGTGIPNPKLSTALFYCGSKDLRQDLMRDLREDVAAMSEEDLLAAMRRLAVKEESALVHRMKLSKMTQAPGTSIRTFLASLRGQAALCSYTVKCTETDCTHTFDYSNEIIKDNLIRGIYDPEILSDLLGDTKTDRTLEEVVTFIAQKEQGKATRSAVGDNVVGAISHPQTEKFFFKNKQKVDHQGVNKCWACGGHSHGPKNNKNTRERKCPAWQSTCTKCNIKGHYSKTCSKCSTCGQWGHRNSNSKFCKNQERDNAYQTEDNTSHNEDNGNAFQTESENLYAQLATVASCPNKNRVNSTKSPIDHIVFEDKWYTRPSKPHPIVLAQLTPLPEDHFALGYPIGSKAKLSKVTVPMVADSGCQSSIIPLASALSMGYDKKDIMPVKLSMRGAINEDLAVEGGIIVEISINDDLGKPRKTRQLVYVSPKMEKAFLCREAMEKLDIIPRHFPEITTTQMAHHMSSTDKPELTCNCPKRGQGVPPLPTSIPPGLSATEQDVPRLKEWLLDYYGATTFNICEHQTLPMMSGEPLKLYVDPDAKPIAAHRPAIVPIHWQEQVYNDLERDVKLGVLEKVPPNTPVTWCSRMVVTSKADGSPRRTVDLQPQNKHAVRQTHHVPTPFHLADRVPQNTKTVTDAWNGYHTLPNQE